MSWDGTWTKISESGIGTNTVTGKYKLTGLTAGNTNSRTITIVDRSGNTVGALQKGLATYKYAWNVYTVCYETLYCYSCVWGRVVRASNPPEERYCEFNVLASIYNKYCWWSKGFGRGIYRVWLDKCWL